MIGAAVKGMLPKNALGRATYGKLKIYAATITRIKRRSPKFWNSRKD